MDSVTVATPAAAGAGDSPAPQPRLVQAAHEFEAQMMKELLRPMSDSSSITGEDQDSRNSDGDSDGGSDSGSGSGGALGEFASEALGRALSERGGFGIASSIVKDLSHSGNKSSTSPVTGNRTGIP